MKIGIIGCGRIFAKHFEAIKALGDQAQITAIADSNTEKLAAVSGTDISKYSDFEEMLDNHDLDFIAVLVESGLHKEIGLRIAKRRIPVLIEKPLALSTNDGLRLLETFKANKTPLFVVKQNRLNPPVKQLLKSVNAGHFGKLVFASASVLWCRTPEYYLQDSWRLSRQLDGGVVWNQASHYVDLLVQVLGSVESVFAYGHNFFSPAETEDTVFALIRSKEGILASLQATTTIRPKNFEGSLTVSGNLGTMRIGGHALNRLEYSTISLDEGNQVAENSISKDFAGGVDVANVYGSSHELLYREIFGDLSTSSDSQFRAENTILSLAVMEAIHISIDQNREVYINEIL